MNKMLAECSLGPGISGASQVFLELYSCWRRERLISILSLVEVTLTTGPCCQGIWSRPPFVDVKTKIKLLSEYRSITIYHFWDQYSQAKEAFFDSSKYPDTLESIIFRHTSEGFTPRLVGIPRSSQQPVCRCRRRFAERSPSITYHRVISFHHSHETRKHGRGKKRNFLKTHPRGCYLFDLYKRAVRPW